MPWPIGCTALWPAWHQLNPGTGNSPSGLRPGGGLAWAAARHETPYGEAVVRWELDGDVFLLSVSVPAGCTAAVYLPDGGTTGVEVGSGTHSFSCAVPEAATEGAREPVFQP